MSDMEWEDMEPAVKVVPWAQASVYVNKDAKPRIRVFFSEAFLNACGHPKAADVQFGARDGKAMLRIVWKLKGKFNIGDLGRGGARIQNIPSKDPAPDGHRESEPCEVVSKTTTEAVLVLPLEAWAAQLNRPAPPPKPAPPPPPPPPPKQGVIEAVPYLRAKGVKVSKLAGDWWMMDGSRIGRMDVLARVNEHRKAADLKPLSVDQIE